MSNATGLRDQQVRVYERMTDTTNGLVRKVFQYRATWWARCEDVAAQIREIGGRGQMKVDGVAEFADEAKVYVLGVIKDDNGTLWWVQGFYGARATRRLIVHLLRLTEEQVATFAGSVEGDSVLDGVHLTGG